MLFRRDSNQVPTIRPEEVQARLARGDRLRIVDVREPNEYVQGHIPGAELIPLGDVLTSLQRFNRGEETILVCRSGNRSGRAAEWLTERGFKAVNMVGGMLEWKGRTETGR